MRYFLFLLTVFFINLKTFAQVPTQKEMQTKMFEVVNNLKQQIAELEKKITDAKKNKEDPESIKEMEEELTMLKSQLSLINKVTKSVASVPKKTIQQISESSEEDIPKFPKFNPAVIEALPKINSHAALISYIADLHNRFMKKINPELVASFKQIETQLEKDPEKMASAAVAAWYSQALSQSILLITKAAMQPKASGLTMNNLGAILNMGGLELRAIPILTYLVNQYPNNSMLLNNLGQSYAGVGDLNRAMMYFGRCLQIEPNHPQANNTAGQIELSRGNTSAATQHFKNSLNGAYTEDAARRVRFVEPELDIMDYIKSRIHIPEYFNEDKYNLPPQCQNVNEAEALTAVYNGYKDMVGKMIARFYSLKNEYTDKTHKHMLQRAKDALAVKKLSNPPFYVQAGYAWDVLLKKYKTDGEWLMQVDKDFEIRKKQAYDRLNQSNGSSDCAAQTGKINAYLSEMADITKAWQRKHVVINKKYINQLIYWSFLFSFSSDEFKMKYYMWVINYLEEMYRIARTELWGPPCKQIDQGNTPAQEIPLEEPHCPIDFEFKLIVGKIALNCQHFVFSGGEIVKFKYEKNFPSKQSTLSLGIGATLELGGNAGGGFSGSTSVNLGEAVFITLDGNNNFADFGMNAQASISAEVSLVSQQLVSGKANLECSAGINSGLTISGSSSVESAPLKPLY
jgi:tetratricopeptide (TPR) repeat protein